MPIRGAYRRVVGHATELIMERGKGDGVPFYRRPLANPSDKMQVSCRHANANSQLFNFLQLYPMFSKKKHTTRQSQYCTLPIHHPSPCHVATFLCATLKVIAQLLRGAPPPAIAPISTSTASSGVPALIAPTPVVTTVPTIPASEITVSTRVSTAA